MADRRLAALAGAALSALALAGCSLAPAYAPPKLSEPLPTAYKEAGPWTPAAPADAAPRGPWWAIFNDATLDGLERRIDTANPDLEAAIARYDQARALVAQARARLFPEFDLDSHVTRARQSDFAPRRGVSPTYYNDNALGGEVNYEFDFWGRVRNTVATQRGLAQAGEADVASARLFLQAQLAQDYLSLRSLDAEQRVLADSVAAYGRALQLTQTRYDEGAASGLDVGRARAQLEAAKALQAVTLSSRSLYEHAIGALVGVPASSFAIAPDERAFPAPPAVPVTAASGVLQRRPDVAAAERRAYAANAQIGVARAALYPTVTLDALGGFETSVGAQNLVSTGAAFWTLGPQIFLPIFDAGRRKAVVDQTRAQFDEAAANYKSTVLGAFQQVEDDLALCNRLAEAAQSEAAAADAAARTEDIATRQYREGATTFLDVIVAQTAALDAKRALIDLQSRRLTATVDLIRAMGGGWSASGAAELPLRPVATGPERTDRRPPV